MIDLDCDCLGTDVQALQRSFDGDLSVSHPHLFATTPVFVRSDDVRQVESLITAIESAVSNPGFMSEVLARAPAIARIPQPTIGAMVAYDFHVTDDGPRLIEINTNAGGALLNVVAQRFQLACCPAVDDYLRATLDPDSVERAIVGMFRAEWHRARGGALLRSIAIVDDDPAGQYLAPEFALFQRLFERHGIRTVIADARSLEFRGGSLLFAGQPIDLVYNRLTDFYLEHPSHAALSAAYVAGATVVTPHPRAHALLAHKENLALLTDEAWLRAAGIPREVDEVLRHGIPRTVRVDGDADAWWASRARWFFKPASGFGSRATYRGDKLTRRVFGEILRGGYVAQEFTPPGERKRTPGCAGHKFDIRAYTDNGRPYLYAARLYQGQTTNFRTPGGGFAPVYVRTEAGEPLPIGLCSAS